MCYSAQVIQLARKLYRQLGIRIDYDEAERLFFRRLDDSTLNISRGFEANFEDPTDDRERRVKAAIDEHRARLATKFESELFAQKTRQVKAIRSLEAKETKKARADCRIAASKIETLARKLSDLRRVSPEARDDRIFPMNYTGVIVREGNANVLTPMRYFCRPAGKPASYDRQFPGLYNARRDNLEKFWREQFGRHHAVMVVERFYENVSLHTLEHRALAAGENERNVVLEFSPEPAQTMLVACLWSHWRETNQADVRGFAAITDEPPASIAAAGHDRCIMNLKPDNIEAWLTPTGRSLEQLQNILSDQAVSLFQHAAAA